MNTSLITLGKEGAEMQEWGPDMSDIPQMRTEIRTELSQWRGGQEGHEE